MPGFEDHAAAVALFEERHFGRAARRLSVTQPALTARLRRLEAIVGARLFERSRSGVVPTAAGSAFVEGARRVLDAAGGAVEAARAARDGFGLMLRIGLTQIAAAQIVAPVLAAFRRDNPHARLLLTESTTAGLERALEQGRIDAAFAHPPLHAPGLSQRVLWRAVLERRQLDPATAGRPLVRYPRQEAPVMMGQIDRTPCDSDDTLGAAEADTAVGALALSAAGYGPAIVPQDFPSFGFPSPEATPLATITLETCVAWRSLDRRPAIKSLLAVAHAVAGDSEPTAKP